MIVGVVRETKREERREVLESGAERGSITCQAVAGSLGLAHEPVEALGGKG